MKKLFGIIYLISFSMFIFCQEGEQTEGTKTKFSEFISASGHIVSFEDYNSTSVTTLTGVLSIEKRIVKSLGEEKAFLLFTMPTKYSTRSNSIAEEDYNDFVNALNTLIADSKIDITTKAGYMEKFYVTEDNLKIGYYVKTNQVKWYIDLDTRLSESTFFINDINVLFAKIENVMKG